MRSFLKKLALFVVMGAAGYAVLFFVVLLLNGRAAQNCSLEPNVNAVIVGDSHTMWAIDDGKIPGLRNISLNAEAYKFSYAKLKRVFQQDPTVKRVYVGVGEHNFSAYYDDYIAGASFKFFAYRYLSVLRPADYGEVFRRNPAEFLRLTKLVITNGFRPGLKGQCELYGQFPSEKQEQIYDPSHMHERVASQYFDDGKVLGTSDSNIEYLEKIVQLCEERGVGVTILSTPVHEEYAAEIPPKFRRLLLGFVQKHHLRFYDFNALRLPDSDFLPDGDHLNYRGSLEATERFLKYHELH